MSSSRPLVRAAALALCLILAAPTPTGAQAPPGDLATPQLRLVSQPVWHEPGDDLSLRLRVENDTGEDLEGFRLTLVAHSRVASRSALHESFQGNAGFEASSHTVEDFAEEVVPAGEELPLSLDDPLSTLTSLSAATESGVYPLTITLFEAGTGEALDAIVTPLILYPTPPEVPLRLVIALPLNDLPRRGPSGAFEESEGWPLERAVGEGGWLRGWADALLEATEPPDPEPPRERRTRGRNRRANRRRPDPPVPKPQPRPLHIAVAPTPRLLEEVADMANGYRRSSGGEIESVPEGAATALAARDVLGRLRTVLGRSTVQPLLAPYSFPDLPSVVEHSLERTGAQFREGDSVLRATTGVTYDERWLFPPAGRIDQRTLETLRSSATGNLEGSRVLVASEALEAVDPNTGGCPAAQLTFTCPIVVRTTQGASRGLATDEPLQERLTEAARGSESRLVLQRVFAETATIREELPGQEGRVVFVSVPSIWHPHPLISKLLVNGLARAPWLETVTPNEALAAPTELEAPDRRLQTASDVLRSEPDEDYFDAIAEAHDITNDFKSMGPPAETVQRLARNVMAAESRSWWQDPSLALEGRAFAEETIVETTDQMSKVRISSQTGKEIRLTSNRGTIPIVILNDADYSVDIGVSVTSPNLNLDEFFPETIPAGGIRQLEVDVKGQSSGIFQVQVALETPDGERSFATTDITVRSTNFNDVALTITIGAAAFLILFYLARLVRRRRKPPEEAATGAPA